MQPKLSKKTELMILSAFLLALTIFSIALFPHSADPLLELARTFFLVLGSVFSGALAGYAT